jgi:hypothetical protein
LIPRKPAADEKEQIAVARAAIQLCGEGDRPNGPEPESFQAESDEDDRDASHRG